MNADDIRTDLKYALKQLRGIDQRLPLAASALDRVQRAIDALERIEAEIEADSADASDKR